MGYGIERSVRVSLLLREPLRHALASFLLRDFPFSVGMADSALDLVEEVEPIYDGCQGRVSRQILNRLEYHFPGRHFKDCSSSAHPRCLGAP